LGAFLLDIMSDAIEKNGTLETRYRRRKIFELLFARGATDDMVLFAGDAPGRRIS